MIVIQFEVKPENRDQFLEVLKAQAQTTKAEDGCQQYDIMLPNNQSTSWWSKGGATRHRTLHTSTDHRSPRLATRPRSGLWTAR